MKMGQWEVLVELQVCSERLGALVSLSFSFLAVAEFFLR